jgi:hypothetical protein
MSDTVLTPPADNQTPDAPATETPAAPADWRAGLPEDLRGEKMFENIKGKDWVEAGPTLAKGYRDAQKLVGSGIMRVPGKDAKPEEVAKWKSENLGKLAEAGLIDAAPAASDKYEAKLNLPEGRAADPKSMSRFYDVAHKNGLSDRQAQAVLDLYVELQDGARDSIGGSAKEAMTTLEREWGGAVQHNLGLAQRAVAELGGRELMELLDTTGLGNHPALIRVFHRVGKVLSEDDPVFAMAAGGGADEAKTKLASIMNDPKHAYWNGEAPGHKDAVAEVRRLNEIIHS